MVQLEKAKTNTDRRRLLVDALHRKHPEMNGRAERVADRLLLNKQEVERKEGWFTWLVKAPFRAMGWVWQKMKEHPYITAAAVIALLYFTGIGSSIIAKIQAWRAAGYDAAAARIGTSTITPAAPAAPNLLPPGVTHLPVPPPPAAPAVPGKIL